MYCKCGRQTLLKEVFCTGCKEKLIEGLASIEHDQWAYWAKGLMESEKNISPERLKRWKELTKIPYGFLSEEAQDVDRKLARRVMDYLKDFFCESK